MSYCVNCGVELHSTSRACPLCNTVVYNPSHPVDTLSPTPYPTEVGQSETVRNHEIGILFAIVLFTASVVCGILNWTVFTNTKWSFYVIGLFIVGWVMLMPVFFRNQANPFLYIGLDGLVIALYVGMIAMLHPGQGWYPEIAFPIILVSTVLFELFYLFTIRMKTSRITKAIVIVSIIAVITVCIEVLIRFHFERYVRLVWSAVVLACCVSVIVILVLIALHQGLRNELRRRMHF